MTICFVFSVKSTADIAINTEEDITKLEMNKLINENQNLSDKIIKLNDEIQKLKLEKDAFSEKDQELIYLKKKNVEFKNRNEEYETTIDQNYSTIDKLQNLLKEQNSFADQYNAKITEHSEKYNSLVREFQNLQTKFNQNTSETEVHLRKIQQLEQQLGEKVTLTTNKELDRMRAALEEVKNINKDYSEKLNNFEKINSEIKLQNKELMDNKNELLQASNVCKQNHAFKITQIETELEKMKVKYAEQKKKILELEKLKKMSMPTQNVHQLMRENSKLKVSLKIKLYR